MKIVKIVVNVHFEDGSTVLENFAHGKGIPDWLDSLEYMELWPTEEKGDVHKGRELEGDGLVKIEQ